jgi:hypothetical protein
VRRPSRNRRPDAAAKVRDVLSMPARDRAAFEGGAVAMGSNRTAAGRPFGPRTSAVSVRSPTDHWAPTTSCAWTAGIQRTAVATRLSLCIGARGMAVRTLGNRSENVGARLSTCLESVLDFRPPD